MAKCSYWIRCRCTVQTKCYTFKEDRNCLSDEPKLIKYDERVDENCEAHPSTNVSCNSESQCNTEPVSMSNDICSVTVPVQSRPVRNKKLPSSFFNCLL